MKEMTVECALFEIRNGWDLVEATHYCDHMFERVMPALCWLLVNTPDETTASLCRATIINAEMRAKYLPLSPEGSSSTRMPSR